MRKVAGELLRRTALGCVLSATAALSAAPAQSSSSELVGLRFPHSAAVRRDMVFRSFPQTCLYAETPTKWSTDWGKMSREPYPYLYRVPSRDANVRADVVFEDFERRLDKGTYQVTVLSGKLKLAQLRIADAPPSRDVSLETGQSLTVHAQ